MGGYEMKEKEKKVGIRGVREKVRIHTCLRASAPMSFLAARYE